jgi:hypothetical protein
MEYTEKEKLAIEKYSQSSYRAVNQALRSGIYDADSWRIIAEMDSAMKKTEATEAFVVYRNFGTKQGEKLAKGTIEKGFLSCSTSEHEAREWVKNGFVGKIIVEKYDNYLIGNKGEAEIILPRNKYIEAGRNGIVEIN